MRLMLSLILLLALEGAFPETMENFSNELDEKWTGILIFTGALVLAAANDIAEMYRK